MRRNLRLFILLAVALLTAFRFRWQLIGRLLGLPASYDVDVTCKIPVTMPDGVRLMADHFAPRGEGRFPTILVRSIYGRGSDAPFPLSLFVGLPAYLIAACGYNVIAQTTRGRFDSEGLDDGVFADDEPDGRATLEWIASQPWFDGNLSMYGSSYLGYTQWAVTDNAPPYLKAIAPSLMMTRIHDLVFPQGAFALDLVQRWMVIVETIDAVSSGIELRRYMAPNYPPLIQGFNHLPMRDSDHIVIGQPVAFFQRSLQDLRPESDYWSRSDKRDLPARVNLPVHFLGGWYDFCIGGMLQDYEAMKAAGRTPYLTVGPWAHADLPAQATFLRESINWYEAHLKGKPERLRKNPVRVYLMGAGEWREFASWPPPAHSTPLYLNAYQRLAYSSPDGVQSPDTYRYDPANPTPAVGGALFMPPGTGGAKDNTALEARPDVLTYTSPILTEDMDIMGAVKLQLYICSSLEHTDFFGRLCDVHPDGRSFNICDGLVRLSPGKGERQPDGSLKVEVDMNATAHRFLAGHHIRLQVSSGAHPRWSRNTGSGEPVLEATRLLTADQQIFHDAAHPSALVLPVYWG